MSENGVTIPLPEIEGFEERVIAAAARQLLTSRSYDEDGGEVAYRSELARKIEDAVTVIIKEQAREATPGIVKQILAKGVVTTDRYGYSNNSVTPLGELIAKTVREEAYNGNSGRRGAGVFEEVIREQVRGQVKEALEAVVAEARQPILDAMREEAVGVFNRAMAKAVAL